jgi:hypothetical protein
MSPRARTIAYWGTTGLLCLPMTIGGTMQVIHAQFNVDGMIRLGYPLYVLTMVGLWKLCGVGVLLAPRLLLLKEWAYAGFFFLLTGASISHLASGEGFGRAMPPLIFAGLTAASWWLRPAERRVVPAPASDPHPLHRADVGLSH